MGELAAFHVSEIVGMFGVSINVADLNPYRDVNSREAKAIAKHREDLKRFKWRAMVQEGIKGKK